MSASTRTDPQIAPKVSDVTPKPGRVRSESHRRPARSDRFVVLTVLWMAFEWGRPPTPFKVPMLISLTLLASWLFLQKKRWPPQVKLMLAFMALLTLGIPFAGNYFSAFAVTRVVAVIILCIAIPMSQFVDTIPKLHTVLLWMVSIFTYVALYALTDKGNGPGGKWAGMDENYTALFLSVAIAMAFFMMFATRSTVMRILLVLSIIPMIMAIVIGLSRGGFLGLAMVGVYCWFRSPRKIVGIALTIVAVAGLLLLAPQSYWDEMQTIQDPNEGTANLRLEMWRIATWQFADNPVMGVGAGNFPWETYNYETPEQVERNQRTLGGNVTHSMYFELLAEQGTIGVMIFVGLLYFNGRDLRFVARMTNPARRISARGSGRLSPESRRQLALARQHGRMLAGGMIGFFVCSAFVSTLYYSAFWILTGLVVSLRVGVEQALRDTLDTTDEPPPVPSRPTPETGSGDLDRSASLAQLWAR